MAVIDPYPRALLAASYEGCVDGFVWQKNT
jgi:hypothetical protein